MSCVCMCVRVCVGWLFGGLEVGRERGGEGERESFSTTPASTDTYTYINTMNENARARTVPPLRYDPPTSTPG